MPSNRAAKFVSLGVGKVGAIRTLQDGGGCVAGRRMLTWGAVGVTVGKHKEDLGWMINWRGGCRGFETSTETTRFEKKEGKN